MDIRNLITALDTIYPKYFEKSLSTKYVKYSDILPLIRRFSEKKIADIQPLGQSVEGRSIFKISIGRGAKNILIWSQMHGNEPTGTLAIFDVLNYLTNNQDKDFVAAWLSTFRINFIPMLNPDGAEVYERRNALNIDINRDAKALQSPEAQLLAQWREIMQSEWAFNLHDQDSHYSAGRSDKPACISLLAPAFNLSQEVDENRSQTMQLIALQAKLISPFIPGMLARYWADYSARSFGDTFQSLGTKTVLIESGSYPFEKNKETPRKMNFIILLSSLEIIHSKLFLNDSIDNYLAIPENKKNFYDLIIHNVLWKHKGLDLIVDIAVNQNEKPLIDSSDFKIRSKIADIGDLSTEFASLHYQAEGMEIHPALMLPEAYEDSSVIFPHFTLSNFRKGYLLFPLKSFNPDTNYDEIEFHVVPEDYQVPGEIKIEQPADFYLERNNKINVIVVNGEIRELN